MGYKPQNHPTKQLEQQNNQKKHTRMHTCTASSWPTIMQQKSCAKALLLASIRITTNHATPAIKRFEPATTAFK
jgi:hypothetical protein